MAKRMQSPSSINTYKQCPRRYYYSYIEKLPTKPSIHLVRGNIVHSVLEDFFKEIPADETMLRINLMKLLHNHWNAKKEVLSKLGLSENELTDYFIESEHMILNFSNHIISRINKEMKSNLNFEEAFKTITPRSEDEYKSSNYQVRGFIDAIEEKENYVGIFDYKTSKKSIITDAYKLQLAIYSLLYFEKHNIIPNQAGIFFLKDTIKHIDVNEDLLKLAKFEIEQIHAATETNDICDYNKKPSPLCKWSKGQCDFYDVCKKSD